VGINGAEYDEMVLEAFGLWSYWNAGGELKRDTLFINCGADVTLVRTCIVWSSGVSGL
jgi:hypothetical protein